MSDTCLLRNKTIEHTVSSKNSGSVNPLNEFSINLGAKRNKEVAINAYSCFTKFLQRKNIGMAVIIDNPIVTVL